MIVISPWGACWPYFISHHQSEKPMAVVTVEIPSAVAINFANSQYDNERNFLIGNAALDHQGFEVVTPSLEMHAPMRFTAQASAVGV
jgi:hypothetical protein